MRSAAPTLENAEAAQACRGGLECSSYAWQVRRCVYAVCMAGSQVKSPRHLAVLRLESGRNCRENNML